MMERNEEEKSLEEEFFRLHPKVRKASPEEIQRKLNDEERRRRYGLWDQRKGY